MEATNMTYVFYRDHTIVSTAVYDIGSGKWKLAAAITSQQSGNTSRQVHIVRNSPELFSRFEDADRAGMEAAQNWVDLVKRGGPFPLATVPGRPALWHQPRGEHIISNFFDIIVADNDISRSGVIPRTFL
jgi:hypothetical protein